MEDPAFFLLPIIRRTLIAEQYESQMTLLQFHSALGLSVV